MAEWAPPLPGRVRWVAGYFRFLGVTAVLATLSVGIWNLVVSPAARVEPELNLLQFALTLGAGALLWQTGRLLGAGRRNGAWMALSYMIPGLIALAMQGQLLSVPAAIVLGAAIGLVSAWPQLE